MNAVRQVEALPAIAVHAFEGPMLAVCTATRREARFPAEEGVQAPAQALSELISPEDILLDVQADGKRAALGGIAERLAPRAGAGQGAVLNALLRRERLGSTFIGDGVAMPHARIADAARPAVALARLRNAVPFSTPDDDPVDLLLAVLWPEADAKEFVPSLARFWRLLRRTGLAAGLRRSKSSAEAHALITSFGDSRP